MVPEDDVPIDGWVVHSWPPWLSNPCLNLVLCPYEVSATQSQYHFSEVMLKGDLRVPDTPTLLQTENGA
jgi:hypothetical protein